MYTFNEAFRKAQLWVKLIDMNDDESSLDEQLRALPDGVLCDVHDVVRKKLKKPEYSPFFLAWVVLMKALRKEFKRRDPLGDHRLGGSICDGAPDGD